MANGRNNDHAGFFEDGSLGSGTIFCELDLDTTKFTRAQKTVFKEAGVVTMGVEKNYKTLGIKSGAVFDAMRAQAENAYQGIKRSSRATADDIVRAERAKAEKIKQLNNEQFGSQTSLISKLKSHWMAYSAAVAAVGYAANKAVNAASALSEEQNKSNVVFGEGSNVISAWAKSSVDAFGLSERAALSAAGTMGNMWKQLGATSSAASQNSMKMVQLAGDLASFHNVAGGAEEVLLSMQSAFRGEYDALQRYIPTIKAATVQQEAMAMTGKKAAEELTELEKAMAAQVIITRDAGDATGDFARTSDGYANTSRQMTASIEDLAAAIGQKLIPFASDAAVAIRDLAMAATDLISDSAIEIYTAKIVASNYQLELMERGKKNGAVFRWLFGVDKAVVDSGIADATRDAEKLFHLFDRADFVSGGESWAPASKTPTAASVMPNAKSVDAGIKEYERFVDAALKADAERSQSIGELAMLDQKWQADAAKDAKDKVKQDAKDAAKEKKLAADVAGAYGKMYGDMKGKTRDYYDFKERALKEERDNYLKLTKDKAAVDQWHQAQLKDLLEERDLAFGDFFDGVRLGHERMTDSGLTQGLAGQRVFDDTLAAGGAAINDELYGIFSGNKADIWRPLGDKMLRILTDTVAEMAIQWGIQSLAAAGQGLGWWDSGLWKAEKDHIAMIHKGEMVVPSEAAGSSRDFLGRGNDAGFASMGQASGAASKAGAIGFGKSYGSQAAATVAALSTGSISPGMAIAGMLSPGALFGSVVTGLFPAAMMADQNMNSTQAEIGRSIGLSVPGLLGLLGIIGLTGPVGSIAAAVSGIIGAMIGSQFGPKDARMGDLDREAAMIGMDPAGIGPGTGFPGLFGQNTGPGATGVGVNAGGVSPGAAHQGGWGDFDASMSGSGAGGIGGGGNVGAGAGPGAGMGAHRHGGWAVGPDSGYPAMLHGRELVRSEDQVSAVWEANVGGGVVYENHGVMTTDEVAKTISTLNGPFVEIEGTLVANAETLDRIADQVVEVIQDRRKHLKVVRSAA